MSEWAESIREQAARALPQVDGVLRVAGLREPVEVIRDGWGVPHIYAANTDDLYFTQGFVAASERLFQIDLMFRTATGRLSTMFGELALPLDKLARTVGWNRAGRRIAAGWDELSIRIATSWFAGIRAYVDRMTAAPPAYAALSLRPELPNGEDAIPALASCAVFVSWSLSGNFDQELLRHELEKKLGRDAMLDLMPPAGPGVGSNNWVVSGKLTETGKPLLANDPHLAVQTPSLWFECHLAAPGFEVAGVSLPFAPGVPIGHTAHTAWGATNVGGDTQDLYLERLNEDETAALFRDEWEPLTIHHEQIEVRGRDEPVVVEARETRHGPLLDSYVLGSGVPRIVEGGIEEPVALRWIGLEEATPPSTLHRMALAGSFEEFRNEVRAWVCPGQNIVYADDSGTIGYQCTGTYPVRARGDGSEPVPGWTGEFEWTGTIPFEKLPWSVDPPEGFIVTANARPHAADYRHLIGTDFTPPYRARRIEQLLEDGRHSAGSFARIQMDTKSLPAHELLPQLLTFEPDDERQRRPLALLADWDGDLYAESAAAALYEAWLVKIAERTLRPKLGARLFDHYYAAHRGSNAFLFDALPRLLHSPNGKWFPNGKDALLGDALTAALDELTSRFGDDPWQWGSMHAVTFASPLATIPELTETFTAGSVEVGGDEQTIHQSKYEPGSGFGAVVIPSWRTIVDLSDTDETLGVLVPGQSGNPASPHWNDQVGPWSRGEHHRMPFTRAAVEAGAAATLRLSPA
ncbi:MAG: penicillin acylase family protein [Actinomycetota bacterium]